MRTQLQRRWRSAFGCYIVDGNRECGEQTEWQSNLEPKDLSRYHSHSRCTGLGRVLRGDGGSCEGPCAVPAGLGHSPKLWATSHQLANSSAALLAHRQSSLNTRALKGSAAPALLKISSNCARSTL